MAEGFRTPRSVVKIAGTPTIPIDWSVDSNTFYQADSFRLTLALSDLPADRDLDWMSAQAEIEIEIFAGFPQDPERYSADQLESVFFGRVDDLGPDLTARTVSLSGRDMTGKLIDHKSSEKFPNLTASQIAIKLAEARGLTPVVTATETKAGRFYQIDRVRLQDDQTEWDLLTWLAREEGFVVYTKGRELHFEPRPDASGEPYPLTWQKPAEGPPVFSAGTLSLSRSLTLAKDIAVTVRTWDTKSKKTTTVTKRRATRAKKAPGEVQQYVYNIPGLTTDQATKRATALLEELTQQEMKIAISGPADNGLAKTSVLRLSGTGTAWDQVYFPSSIQRRFGRRDGYVWQIDAKNHNVESEPVL